MNALIGALRVSLSAETAQFEAGMKRAQRTADKTNSAFKKSFGGLSSTVKAGLAGAISGLSLGLMARGFIAATDAAKKLDAQLKLATMASGNFAKAQQDVYRIAQTTRTGLEETAQLYATFQRNALELGITQEQAARATETVSKAFQISGASAAEAAGGLRQFLQGIQSGTLRGEELNSVLENAPRLAKLVAESLGVTIGQLRAMGKEGELTADKLIRALTDKKFTAGIDAEFKELPVTFDQAMTQVQNAAIITFGAFDRGGEFSKALVTFISDGTGGFADLATSAENLGIEIRAVMAGLADAFEPMLAGARSVFGEIRSEAEGLKRAIADVLSTADAIANAVPRAINAATGSQIPLSDLSGKFTRGADKSTFDRRKRLILSSDAMSRALSEFGGSTRPIPRAAATSGGAAKKGRSKADDAERKRLKALRDAFQFDQELLRAQTDVLRARQQLAIEEEDRSALAIQMLNLEKQGFQREMEYAVAAGDLTKAQASQLEAEFVKKDELERQAVLLEEQTRRQENYNRLEELDFDLQRGILQSQEQLATTAKEQRAIRLRLLDLDYRAERARLETILADEQASYAAKEEARRRLLALNKTEANDRQGVINSTMGPMEQFRSDFSDITEEMEELQVRGIMGAVDALASLTEGFDTFKQNAISAIKAVIAEFIRLQMMKMIANLIGTAAGAPPGMGSISVTGLPSSLPPGFATGGSFNIMGRQGVDKNLLSLNGLPIARVSHGERVDISNDNSRGATGGHSLTQNFYGAVSRETAMQAGARARAGIAQANRKGA